MKQNTDLCSARSPDNVRQGLLTAAEKGSPKSFTQHARVYLQNRTHKRAKAMPNIAARMPTNQNRWVT